MELTETLSPEVIFETPAPALRRVRNQFKAAYDRVFGCWHRDMSRPITRQRKTYRVCMDCGANRAFDTEHWKMVGPYFCDVAPQTEAQVQATLNS
jgi:hypothetical protein